MKDFVNDTSREIWRLFVKTGNPFIWMLYNAVQNPELVDYRLNVEAMTNNSDHESREF